MLAHEFKRADVGRFLNEISSSEYAEWVAFFKLREEARKKAVPSPKGKKGLTQTF